MILAQVRGLHGGGMRGGVIEARPAKAAPSSMTGRGCLSAHALPRSCLCCSVLRSVLAIPASPGTLCWLIGAVPSPMSRSPESSPSRSSIFLCCGRACMATAETGIGPLDSFLPRRHQQDATHETRCASRWRDARYQVQAASILSAYLTSSWGVRGVPSHRRGPSTYLALLDPACWVRPSYAYLV